jgi:hypothetical protein
VRDSLRFLLSQARLETRIFLRKRPEERCASNPLPEDGQDRMRLQPRSDNLFA